jgi:hypothetical protein
VRPRDPLEDLIALLHRLRPDQVERIEAFARALSEPPEVSYSTAGFATEAFVHRFGDALRQHHMASHEPFTKDKFEHAMLAALRQTGHAAELAPRGHPGHDITVDGERWSLKTEAAAAIKRDTLHISKFMELGKGRWETDGDLSGLREQMFRHMEAYDRIFSLRCFRTALINGVSQHEYELVEIPKSLLLEAKDADLRLSAKSKTIPKSGEGIVKGKSGLLIFRLLFDGGTERKLQITHLSKAFCKVLATWRLTVK